MLANDHKGDEMSKVQLFWFWSALAICMTSIFTIAGGALILSEQSCVGWLYIPTFVSGAVVVAICKKIA